MWCGGRIKFNCSSAGIGDATYIHTLNHIRCSVGCGVVDVSNSIEVAPVLVMLHTYILLLTSDIVWWCGVVDVSNSTVVALVLVMLHTYILLLTSDVVWGVVWWTYQIQLK